MADTKSKEETERVEERGGRKLPPWKVPKAPEGDRLFQTAFPMRVYNSLTRTKVPFVPRHGNRVYLYNCGPTVYAESHLGHMRAAIALDLVRRVLSAPGPYGPGLSVTTVVNVTDVDDKIIMRSRQSEVPFAGLARRFEREYFEDMAAVGILPPDVVTRVSEYIPEVIALVEAIMERGYGYVANGSVYFDTSKFSSDGRYGKLEPEAIGNVALTEEGEGALSAETGRSEKRSQTDFALWKASKEGEPSWESPWGPGRPGWHVECSAMSSAIMSSLAPGADGGFDVHMGGVDLKFPHHENEIAQAEAALGTSQWVNYWMHAGHLNIDGMKMSKSLKNFTSIREALESYPASRIRLFFLMHRYNAPASWSELGMNEAAVVEKRFSEFFHAVKAQLRAAEEEAGPVQVMEATGRQERWGPRERDLARLLETMQDSVRAALMDDIDTPTVLDAMLSVVAATNRYINGEAPTSSAASPVTPPAGFPAAVAASKVAPPAPVPGLLRWIANEITKILRLLGLIDAVPNIGFSTGASASREETLQPVLDALATFRARVRAAARDGDLSKVLEACDQVRDDALPPLGIRLEDDAAAGSDTVWKLDDPEKLMREIEEKRAAERAREEAKAAKREAAEKKAEQDRQYAAIPPTELFKVGEHAGKYSQFDETGMPTHLTDGEPVPKSARKKLDKELKKHAKLREKLGITDEAPSSSAATGGGKAP